MGTQTGTTSREAGGGPPAVGERLAGGPDRWSADRPAVVAVLLVAAGAALTPLGVLAFGRWDGPLAMALRVLVVAATLAVASGFAGMVALLSRGRARPLDAVLPLVAWLGVFVAVAAGAGALGDTWLAVAGRTGNCPIRGTHQSWTSNYGTLYRYDVTCPDGQRATFSDRQVDPSAGDPKVRYDPHRIVKPVPVGDSGDTDGSAALPWTATAGLAAASGCLVAARSGRGRARQAGRRERPEPPGPAAT